MLAYRCAIACRSACHHLLGFHPFVSFAVLKFTVFRASSSLRALPCRSLCPHLLGFTSFHPFVNFAVLKFASSTILHSTTKLLTQFLRVVGLSATSDSFGFASTVLKFSVFRASASLRYRLSLSLPSFTRVHFVSPLRKFRSVLRKFCVLDFASRLQVVHFILLFRKISVHYFAVTSALRSILSLQPTQNPQRKGLFEIVPEKQVTMYIRQKFV
jgi:hypothetical protein